MANIVTIFISIVGSLTLMAGVSFFCLYCSCRKQPEKDAKSDPEKGRFISENVATKIDAKNHPTLLTSAQSTSSGNPICHIEDDNSLAEPNVKHHPVQAVRGLKNLGNTCYFNSTMQALVHTNSKFREELEALRTKGKFVEEVLKFFSAMQSDNSKPYSPYDLHRLFGQKSPRFADDRQHDSHECLRNFLDNIRKEERDNSGAVDEQRVLTVVDSVFGGHFVTVYICKDCGTPYHVFEALLDISLPIMIHSEALAAMNSAPTRNQSKSMTVKLRSQWSKMKQWALQSDKSKKGKLIISPTEPDCESTTMEDDIGQKTSKGMQDNISDVTVRHKSADQSKSNTERSIAEINSTVVLVHPTTTDKTVVEDKAEAECDKQSVSQVTIEEVKENAVHEKDAKQAPQNGNKENNEKEVEEEEEETRQANNEVKCTDTTVNEDEEEDAFYDAREEVTHKLEVRADGDNLTVEVKDFEEVIKEDGNHYREAIDGLMTPLSLSSLYLPNDQTAISKHVTIHDCLSYFTRKEPITKEYLCHDCNGRHPPNEGEALPMKSAMKQTLIFNPPAILTLHLKRFALKPGGSVKRNDMITYKELLDIAPYCSSMCLRNDPPCQNIWYSLYCVVVHHGSTLKSGHYTAYVKIRDRESDAGFGKLLQKNFFDKDLTRERLIEMMHEKTTGGVNEQGGGTWYCMNDSSVREVSVTTILNQEAYLLFYERRP